MSDQYAFFEEGNKGSTREQKLYHDKNSYESQGIKWHLKHQWLPVVTDAIEKATGYSRRLQLRVFRSMAKSGQIGYKRIEDKTWINLNGGEFIEIPRPRPGRVFIKGPVEMIGNVAHYKWCMTCKGTERLTKAGITHNLEGDVQHYVCHDCEKERRAKRMVPEEKWRLAYNGWQSNKKRAEKAEAELKALKLKYGIPLRKYNRWNPRPENFQD